MLLYDHRVIHRHGDYAVLGQRHEVMFADGQAVGLHPVQLRGVPQMFLRCLVHDELHCIVFDLRDLVPALDAELRATHERDVPGLVFYTLRGAFSTAAAFRGRVLRKFHTAWLRDDCSVGAAPLSLQEAA